jgi:ankyrin repeat protein
MIKLICNHIRATNHLANCLVKGETGTESDQRCSCPSVYPRLDDTDVQSYTALHIGAFYGFHSAVSLLLHYSKSIADTPMSRETISTKLLLAGKPHRWCTPVYYAIYHEERLGDMYKILINAGADVNMPSSRGQTPLMIAKKYENAEAISILLAHGAKPTLPPLGETEDAKPHHISNCQCSLCRGVKSLRVRKKSSTSKKRY